MGEYTLTIKQKELVENMMEKGIKRSLTRGKIIGTQSKGGRIIGYKRIQGEEYNEITRNKTKPLY